MPFFLLTVFLSAFLLFQIQPLAGRILLPLYGGTPAVWLACLMFFQVMLLAGYLYAHLTGSLLPRLVRRFAPAAGPLVLPIVFHSLLLAFVGILPLVHVLAPDAPDSNSAIAIHGAAPVAEILGFLLRTLGAPYLLLAATGPLLQAWFSTGWPDRPPWRLYALSNAGSLLGLITYPVLVEPVLRLDSQTRLWWGGFGAFVLLCVFSGALVAFRARSIKRTGAGPSVDRPHDPAAPPHATLAPSTAGDASTARDSTSSAAGPSFATLLLWLALAFFGSLLLMGVTNQLCQEIASVPFLWVIPLALYLVTFIICFDSPRWYRRRWAAPLMFGSFLVAALILPLGTYIHLPYQIAAFSLALFAGCMACHGELYRARPAPAHLTLFYLTIAAGGALGGIVAGFVAPLAFPLYLELPLALIGAPVVVAMAWWRARGSIPFFRKRRWPWFVLAEFLLLLVFLLGYRSIDIVRDSLAVTRDFFGVVRVEQSDSPLGPRREMIHGSILHGLQFMDPDKRDWPTTYFGPHSGVGYALRIYPELIRLASLEAAGPPHDPALHIGVVGLGVGTLATYGRPDDRIVFYEISPDVEQLARNWFTYLEDSPATVSVRLGDARLQLTREALANEGGDAGIAGGHQTDAEGSSDYQEYEAFDILILDAFSSDAIPIHLLTREAVDLYLKRLVPEGILCFQITNRMVNLLPVLRAHARHFDLEMIHISAPSDPERGVYSSEWVLLTRNEAFVAHDAIVDAAEPWFGFEPIVWTDDYSSLWRVIRW